MGRGGASGAHLNWGDVEASPISSLSPGIRALFLHMRKLKPGEPLVKVTSKTEVGESEVRNPLSVAQVPPTSRPPTMVGFSIECQTFGLCSAVDSSGLKS